MNSDDLSRFSKYFKIEEWFIWWEEQYFLSKRISKTNDISSTFSYSICEILLIFISIGIRDLDKSIQNLY